MHPKAMMHHTNTKQFSGTVEHMHCCYDHCNSHGTKKDGPSIVEGSNNFCITIPIVWPHQRAIE